ncbi:hypothetical protein FHS08_001166 [Microbacterium ulmi]|nr:hypothetical protein [Microbacterium ulmi]
MIAVEDRMPLPLACAPAAVDELAVPASVEAAA